MCGGGAIYITHSSAPMPPTYFFSPLSQKLDLNEKEKEKKKLFGGGKLKATSQEALKSVPVHVKFRAT